MARKYITRVLEDCRKGNVSGVTLLTEKELKTVLALPSPLKEEMFVSMVLRHNESHHEVQTPELELTNFAAVN